MEFSGLDKWKLYSIMLKPILRPSEIPVKRAMHPKTAEIGGMEYLHGAIGMIALVFIYYRLIGRPSVSMIVFFFHKIEYFSICTYLYTSQISVEGGASIYVPCNV
jgi:hypothetical protein